MCVDVHIWQESPIALSLSLLSTRLCQKGIFFVQILWMKCRKTSRAIGLSYYVTNINQIINILKHFIAFKIIKDINKHMIFWKTRRYFYLQYYIYYQKLHIFFKKKHTVVNTIFHFVKTQLHNYTFCILTCCLSKSIQIIIIFTFRFLFNEFFAGKCVGIPISFAFTHGKNLWTL